MRGGGSAGAAVDRDRAALAWLRKMAPSRLTGFLGGRTRLFTWSDAPTLRREVERAMGELHAERTGFLRHLLDKGWLDRGWLDPRAPLRDPTLVFRWSDRRRDRSVPLPGIEGVD